MATRSGGGGGLSTSAGPMLVTRVTPSPLDVYHALEKAGDAGRFQAELVRDLDNVSKQGAVAVRNAVRQLKTKGRKSTGLRERVANTVSTKTRLGGGWRDRKSEVYVIADAAKMVDPKKRSLIRHLDRGRWRHPIFGNDKKWVTQRTGGDYFYAVLDDFHGEWTKAVLRAMEHTAQIGTGTKT